MLSGLWANLPADPCGTLYQFAQSSPGQPALLEVGTEKVLVVQDPLSVGRVLQENAENYRKNFGSFVAVFGQSRLTSDGADWRRLQRLSQPFINPREPARIEAAVSRHFGRAADGMLSGAGSAGVQIDRYLDRAAAGVVLETIFGLALDAFEEESWDDLRFLLRYCGRETWRLPGHDFRQGPDVQAEAHFRLGRLRHVLRAILADEKLTSADTAPLLHAICQPETGVPDTLGEFATLLFASFDTTASALGWSLWLLAVNAGLQERLRDEIRTADAAGPQDLSRVPSLKAFVNEALRIFPPVPILSRIAVAADTLGSNEVEPGCRVLISVIGMHHDARVWPDSFKVRIERFPSGEIPRDKRAHFLPFGGGPRRCGGMPFAMIELPLALMILLRRMRFRMANRDALQFEWGASLRRAHGQHLVIDDIQEG